MRWSLRIALTIITGVSLYLTHLVISKKMEMPDGAHWEWLVLGYSGLGIAPSFAAAAANFITLILAIFLGLCAGAIFGKAIELKSSVRVLIFEMIACGMVYGAGSSLSISWWNQPSKVEAMAMICFFACSYFISRTFILAIWTVKRKWVNPLNR
jgi:hypothetical protein